MSFQTDIAKYLEKDTLPLMQEALFDRMGLPSGRTVWTARGWGVPQPSLTDNEELKILRAGIIASAKQLDLPKDADPVEAWEPRICEDGVIIRGPPSEDTPPPRPSKE